MGLISSLTLAVTDGVTTILCWTSVGRLVGLWLAYRAVVALYNISPLHPLYRFPGPKLAAMGYLYEAYFDFWLVGRYSHEIKRMHGIYGPVVRINPDELHCNDPRFTDDIYAGGNRVRDKWRHFLNTGAAGPISVGSFSTPEHEKHRVRKGAMTRFFSRAQMLKLEGEVHHFTQRLCDKILRYRIGEPWDIKQAFNCYTADIISQYAFGEPMGFIDQGDWEPNFSTWLKSFFDSAYMIRHVGPVRFMVRFAPLFARYLTEDVRNVMDELYVNIPRHIEKALHSKEDGRIFADLIDSNILPESDKTLYRLSGEGFNLLSAGTETTAASLACIAFYLLSQPAIYRRLLSELHGLDPLHLQWVELEQRPYLWAIIHEALRLMPGISHRSARIARDEELVYRSATGEVEWVIPRGTPIGMTSVINHADETLFPDPAAFIPDRWLLADGARNYALEKNLIAFGRGSRSCLGKDLAYCELYLLTAAMALRVLPRARLYETTVEDVQYDHDLIVPQSKNGSVRVRIVISPDPAGGE